MQLAVTRVSLARTPWQIIFVIQQNRLFHLLGADLMFELGAGNAPICHVLEVIASHS
jgi:hypothetical protein